MGSRDSDRDVILARRNRFIAAALSGLAAASAGQSCGGKVSGDQARRTTTTGGQTAQGGQTARGGQTGQGGQEVAPYPCLQPPMGGYGGGPQVCLSGGTGALGGTGGVPAVCLGATPEGGAPQVCLEYVPWGGEGGEPMVCLSGAAGTGAVGGYAGTPPMVCLSDVPAGTSGAAAEAADQGSGGEPDEGGTPEP